MSRPHHRTRAHASRQKTEPKRPVPTPALDALLAEARIESHTQEQIWQELVSRHHPDITVSAAWQQRAIRLEART